MTRSVRRHAKLAAALSVAISVAALSGVGVGTERVASAASTSARPDKNDRPNIFMITVDDAATGDLAYLPNVRKLIARKGTTLTNAVAPTPICVPARASMLTGQYAHNHGALAIKGKHGGFTSFDDADTLPVWLQEGGYDTFFVGKYLNGYGHAPGSRRYVPPGWTGWHASLDPATYSFFRTAMNRNGRLVTDRGYNSDTFSDVVATTLAAPDRRTKPWYLWVNYVAPHIGRPVEPGDPKANRRLPRRLRLPTTTPAKRHQNTFEHLRLPSRPDMFVQPTGSRVRGTRTNWSRQGRAVLREIYQQRIESLQAVDEAVGRHVRLLKRTGQLDNTLVVFTSDNGYNVGEHNLLGKLWFFDTSLEVPMVISGPGVPRGVTSPSLVSLADLPVTFAAVAGVNPSRVVDGSDVIDLLSDERRGAQRVIPIEAWGVRARSTRRTYSGIRVGRSWTYARLRDGHEELYDLRTDPFMLRNVANRFGYASQLKLLRQLDADYRDCRGGTCPRP